jgi:hypothetical protein
VTIFRTAREAVPASSANFRSRRGLRGNE